MAAAAFPFIQTYCAELYHTKIRATAMGWANSIDRCGGTIMPTLLLMSLNVCPTMPYTTLGICGFLAFIGTYLLPYDTTGKDLDRRQDEDIEMAEYNKLGE